MGYFKSVFMLGTEKEKTPERSLLFIYFPTDDF